MPSSLDDCRLSRSVAWLLSSGCGCSEPSRHSRCFHQLQRRGRSPHRNFRVHTPCPWCTWSLLCDGSHSFTQQSSVLYCSLSPRLTDLTSDEVGAAVTFPSTPGVGNLIAPFITIRNAVSSKDSVVVCCLRSVSFCTTSGFRRIFPLAVLCALLVPRNQPRHLSSIGCPILGDRRYTPDEVPFQEGGMYLQ